MTKSNTEPFVVFENIGKYFINENKEKIPVIDGLDLTVYENEFISLIGPSGCGKTTFLKIIAGFDGEFSGAIKIGEKVLIHKKKESINRKKQGFLKKLRLLSKQKKTILLGKVGYIPQEESLFPWSTVKSNIEFGLNIKTIPKEEKEKIIDDLLKLVGLYDYKNYYPKELSGGMKQKITICRAIAVQPELNMILMDEPFSALDSQARNIMQGDLLDIWEHKKMTIIYVTHNIDEAVYLSQRIAVMSQKPSKIKEIIDVNLPRPRDRTSIEFNNIRRKALNLLSEELQ